MPLTELSEAAPAAGPAARRERQRSEARRTILDATEALLVESGGGDFSIRALSRRCGYSAPTIYNHFGDKDGLIDALLEDRFSRLADAVHRVAPSPDPVRRLRGMARAFLAFGGENPTFYRLISSVSRKGESRTPPAVEVTRESLELPIQALARAGRLRVDEKAASQSLWALMHGLSALQSAQPEHDWAQDLESDALDALLRGLVEDLPEAGQ
jgi:AcrR family transcriptional regulator